MKDLSREQGESERGELENLRRLVRELSTYRDLVDKVNSIILRWDVQGVVTFCNDYGLRFFGYSREELVGRKLVGTIVPETEASGRDLAGMIANILAEPERYVSNENENVCKNGNRVWVSWTNRAILDENGNLLEILSVGNDSTRRKQAEDRLKEHDHFLQQLSDTIPNPIYYKNEKGVYLGCNRAFQEFVGLPREKIIGKTIFDIAPLEFAKNTYERNMTLLRRSGEQVYEGKMPHADGSLRDVIFNNATFSDSEREVAGLVGVIVDITVRKRAENALLESEHKFRSIVEQSLDGFILVNERGLTIEWNGVMEILTGIWKSEAVGKDIWDMLFALVPEERRLPGTRAQLEQSIRGYLATGDAPWLNVSLKTAFRTTSGEIREVRQLSFPIQTEKGFMLGVFVHEICEDDSRLQDEERPKEQ